LPILKPNSIKHQSEQATNLEIKSNKHIDKKPRQEHCASNHIYQSPKGELTLGKSSSSSISTARRMQGRNSILVSPNSIQHTTNRPRAHTAYITKYQLQPLRAQDPLPSLSGALFSLSPFFVICGLLHAISPASNTFAGEGISSDRIRSLVRESYHMLPMDLA
jgi:hypothetical protein